MLHGSHGCCRPADGCRNFCPNSRVETKTHTYTCNQLFFQMFFSTYLTMIFPNVMRLDFNNSSLMNLYFEIKYSINILRGLVFSSSMIRNHHIFPKIQYKLYSRCCCKLCFFIVLIPYHVVACFHAFPLDNKASTCYFNFFLYFIISTSKVLISRLSFITFTLALIMKMEDIMLHALAT